LPEVAGPLNRLGMMRGVMQSGVMAWADR